MILVIDTSSAVSTLALLDQSRKVVREATYPSGRTFDLPARFRDLAGNEALTAVAVATGPGSFTGLRVGVSFGLGLAMGLRIPIFPLATLAIQSARSDEAVLAVAEAGRGRVYFLLPGEKTGLAEPDALAKNLPVVGWLRPSTQAALSASGLRFKPDEELRSFGAAASTLIGSAREVPYGSVRLEYMQSFSAPPRMMVQIRQQLALELMREADVATVQEIEREIFATPWPRNAYYRELASRASAHYVVLRQEGLVERPVGFKASDLDPTIIGYGGMWRMYDEAHVTTIGVRRDLQHRGYGRVIFAGLVQAAYDMGAKWVTLEVRTTNENAMRMYEAFSFKVIGRRKGYYTDNGEDAIVMWSDSIHSPRFRRAYETNLERIDADVRGLRRDLLTKGD